MPRDANGLYQLPAGVTAVPNTLIESEKYNTFTGDMASEMTASLPRDGRAPMTGKLQMPNGSAASPAVQFTAAAQTGFYYDPIGAAVVFVVNGVEVGRFDVSGIKGGKQPGEIFDWAGATPPSGALVCGGQAISRTTYARLFSVIDTKYGAGDGSTTFNVPDLRGRVRAGLDNLGGSDASRMSQVFGVARTTLGGAGGVDAFSLSVGQLPVFTPTGTVLVTYPAHTYQQWGGGSVQLASGVNYNLPTQNAPASTSPPSAVSHSVSMNSVGGGLAHSIVQPTMFALTCIQAL